MTRRTVVFDVGGVLVQWHPLELMRTHFPARAADEAAARALMVQVFQTFTPEADWGAFDRGEVEPAALAERIAARTGLPQAGVAALIAAIPEHLQPMPESVALLERVRVAGHRLALLSNMPRPYALHLERAHACFGWFAHRTWSGFLGVMKPQRAIFDHVRTALDLDLAHAVFIDDHHGNIAAAHRYGWQALQFTSAAQCGADLAAGGWL
ncbi:MAG TPA: HAD-IA family hydrolase [Burkholderiaceae bacterium]|nr:HAD-IA family hydrolase [Burkholderiaceae bacterium]